MGVGSQNRIINPTSKRVVNPPILRSKDVHRTRLPSSYMATWLAQNKAEISQNGSKLNNVSKVTKLHYFLLPHLPSHKEGELPDYTDVALLSGDNLTYFDEGFPGRTRNPMKGIQNKLKAQSFLYWIIFKLLTKA